MSTITIPETAKILGVSQQRVHRFIRLGRLKIVGQNLDTGGQIGHLLSREAVENLEKLSSAKLTEDNVREIRERAENESIRGLAKEFGVKPATIRDAMRRKTWKHVV